MPRQMVQGSIAVQEVQHEAMRSAIRKASDDVQRICGCCLPYRRQWQPWKDWKAEIKAAEMFVDTFSGTGAQANMAVILYSGPRTWGGVRRCVGRNSKKVNIEKTCKIKTVTHFTDDMKKVKSLITGLSWPQGSQQCGCLLGRSIFFLLLYF